MGLWLLVLLVLQAVWKGALEKTHSLHTRGLIELAGAISCGTGRNALAYLGYGCYCGLGGRGWPKDEVDWEFTNQSSIRKCRFSSIYSMSKHFYNELAFVFIFHSSCPVQSHWLTPIAFGIIKQKQVKRKDISSPCCHKHDCCYDKAEREGCNPKMLRYEWTCERNTVVCNRLTDRCQKMVCQCDREAARCWGIAPYNPHYVLWPDFLCGQTNPMCQLT